MIEFRCNACGHRLGAKDSAVGRAVNCPQCKARQIVPGASPADVPIEPERVTAILDDADSSAQTQPASAGKKPAAPRLSDQQPSLEMLKRAAIAGTQRGGTSPPAPVASQPGDGWAALAVVGAVVIGFTGLVASLASMENKDDGGLGMYLLVATPISAISWAGFFMLLAEAVRIRLRLEYVLNELSRRE
ncbi:hypothetical protein [Maioricimonas sp. JC845]|uniref:hypothetical protein n=1 Tax=Maioricimonas sp. JC845 TaxID=3232138 RepID=UPI003457F8C8